MSNTSSADTALRGLVMLGILGGAGWAAVQYTPVLEIAGRKLTEWQCRIASPDYGGGDAPLYRPIASMPVGAAPYPLPLSSDTALVPVATSPPFEENVDAQRAVGRYPGRQVAYERGVAIPQAVASRSEQFLELDAQLAQLGAVYTVLERWGQERPRYRFYCKMAVAGSTTDTRHFEAVGEDPLRLMREVLEQLTAWHAGGGSQ